MTAQKFMAYFEDAVGHLYCSDIIETVILGTRLNPGESEAAMVTFTRRRASRSAACPRGSASGSPPASLSTA